MRRAPAVLLMLLVVYGFLSPPALNGQQSREPQPPARAFRLEQNAPNPFDRETWIAFYLEDGLFESEESAAVTIQIFNVLNQVVAVPRAPDHPRGKNLPVVNLPYAEPGRKLAYWDGKDSQGRAVPSGVYYCQMVVGDQTQMRKMIVVPPRRKSKIPIPWFGTKRSRPD